MKQPSLLMFSPTTLQKVSRVQLRHLYFAGSTVNFWKAFPLITFFPTNISANLVLAAGESGKRKGTALRNRWQTLRRKRHYLVGQLPGGGIWGESFLLVII